MFELRLFLCSDSAAIDLRTNTLCAFHIMEQINAATFPVAIPRISVIALLSREPTDPDQVQYQLQVQLGNQELISAPFAVSFTQQLSARAIAEILGLVLPAPGTLSFILRNPEGPIGSWRISVIQIAQPQLQMFFPAPTPTSVAGERPG